MSDIEKMAASIDNAGEQLFQFAIDRGDMKTILDALPVEMQAKRGVMEYEIQILRIITVGWAIAFFLADDQTGGALGELYWEHVRAFSGTLSASAAMAVNSDIDYFEILKQRLGDYLEALNSAGKIPEPAMVVGPAFAGVCGNKQDAGATLAGSKMFAHTLHAVREYLDGFVNQRN